MVYFTRTFSPFCIPGIHFGIPVMMRSASASNDGKMERMILTFEMLPSFSTIKVAITRPSFFASCASLGYFMFS